MGEVFRARDPNSSRMWRSRFCPWPSRKTLRFSHVSSGKRSPWPRSLIQTSSRSSISAVTTASRLQLWNFSKARPCLKSWMRADLAEAGRRLRGPDRARSLGCAREGSHPPRLEARESLRHQGRAPQDPRLRSREKGRGRGAGRAREFTDAIPAYRTGNSDEHGGLHVA